MNPEPESPQSPTPSRKGLGPAVFAGTAVLAFFVFFLLRESPAFAADPSTGAPLPSFSERLEGDVKRDAQAVRTDLKKEVRTVKDDAVRDVKEVKKDISKDAGTIETDVKQDARVVEIDAVHDAEKAKKDISDKFGVVKTDLKNDAEAVKEDVETDAEKVDVDAKKDWSKFKNNLDRKTAKIKKEFEKIESKVVTDVKKDATVVTDDLYQDILDLMKYSADESRPVPAEDLTVEPIKSALPATPVPLATKNFPDRPKPLVELGNPFFGSGYIDPGFQSFTGAMWQPQFIIFGDMRSAVQTFNTTSDVRTTEWVNRLDLYSNLALTPTERFLLHWQPLNRNTTYSGYQFEPNAGGVNGFLGNIDELYFEGNLLSMFPSLDNYKNNLLYLDMSVGRQIINLQDGILLNDNIDMVGLTHPSLFTFGSSAATVTGFAAWNNISRGDAQISNSAKMFGGVLRTDYSFSTLEVDGIYVNDPGSDGLYVSASAIQRLGPVSTAFRANQSIALGDSSAAISTGTLLFAQLSMAPPNSEDQIYLNLFWGIKSYTSAGRSADAGGPLGPTGILFGSPGIGAYQGVLGGSPQDDFGGALGYQLFIDGHRKQVVFETGFVQNTVGRSNNTVGLGTQYQQAIGQRWVWIVGTDVGFPEIGDTAYGGRTEIQIKF